MNLILHEMLQFWNGVLVHFMFFISPIILKLILFEVKDEISSVTTALKTGCTAENLVVNFRAQ